MRNRNTHSSKKTYKRRWDLRKKKYVKENIPQENTKEVRALGRGKHKSFKNPANFIGKTRRYNHRHRIGVR